MGERRGLRGRRGFNEGYARMSDREVLCTKERDEYIKKRVSSLIVSKPSNDNLHS